MRRHDAAGCQVGYRRPGADVHRTDTVNRSRVVATPGSRRTPHRHRRAVRCCVSDREAVTCRVEPWNLSCGTRSPGNCSGRLSTGDSHMPCVINEWIAQVARSSYGARNLPIIWCRRRKRVPAQRLTATDSPRSKGNHRARPDLLCGEFSHVSTGGFRTLSHSGLIAR